jgi:hypothetical protein
MVMRPRLFKVLLVRSWRSQWWCLLLRVVDWWCTVGMRQGLGKRAMETLLGDEAHAADSYGSG